MDTFREASTLIFILSIVMSTIAAVHLSRKNEIRVSLPSLETRRRKFLMAGLLGFLAIFAIERKVAYDYGEEKVMCHGWMLKRKELKSDACEPGAVD